MLVIVRVPKDVGQPEGSSGFIVTVPPSAEPRSLRFEVLQIRGDGKVTLGFEAPQDCRLIRDDAGNREQRYATGN